MNGKKILRQKLHYEICFQKNYGIQIAFLKRWTEIYKFYNSLIDLSTVNSIVCLQYALQNSFR
jgi:hypothetical protein